MSFSFKIAVELKTVSLATGIIRICIQKVSTCYDLLLSVHNWGENIWLPDGRANQWHQSLFSFQLTSPPASALQWWQQKKQKKKKTRELLLATTHTCRFFYGHLKDLIFI